MSISVRNQAIPQLGHSANFGEASSLARTPSSGHTGEQLDQRNRGDTEAHSGPSSTHATAKVNTFGAKTRKYIMDNQAVFNTFVAGTFCLPSTRLHGHVQAIREGGKLIYRRDSRRSEPDSRLTTRTTEDHPASPSCSGRRRDSRPSVYRDMAELGPYVEGRGVCGVHEGEWYQCRQSMSGCLAVLRNDDYERLTVDIAVLCPAIHGGSDFGHRQAGVRGRTHTSHMARSRMSCISGQDKKRSQRHYASQPVQGQVYSQWVSSYRCFLQAASQHEPAKHRSPVKGPADSSRHIPIRSRPRSLVDRNGQYGF